MVLTGCWESKSLLFMRQIWEGISYTTPEVEQFEKQTDSQHLCPVPFWSEILEVTSIYDNWDQTRSSHLYISAIKSSKRFKSTKVSNYFRASVSKPLWPIHWDFKDNGLLTVMVLWLFLRKNWFLLCVLCHWLTRKYL